jgi:heme/copper-type cytochrome/quinol oxidase subunit 2
MSARKERGRRWYHPRPEPRRRTDFWGFNSTWWMVVVWLIVIVLIVYPLPLW